MPGHPFQRGNNKAAKLTGEQVIEIRERYATERGLSQPMLCQQYDVSKNTIAGILNGSTWRHLLRGAEPQVYRPPLNARTIITDDQVEASQGRLAALLNAQPTKPVASPSLYNDPPPTLAEDNAAGALGLARLQQELDGPGAIKAKQISDELEKFTKGDSNV
jgi:hypothetical protein